MLRVEQAGNQNRYDGGPPVPLAIASGSRTTRNCSEPEVSFEEISPTIPTPLTSSHDISPKPWRFWITSWLPTIHEAAQSGARGSIEAKAAIAVSLPMLIRMRVLDEHSDEFSNRYFGE